MVSEFPNAKASDQAETGALATIPEDRYELKSKARSSDSTETESLMQDNRYSMAPGTLQSPDKESVSSQVPGMNLPFSSACSLTQIAARRDDSNTYVQVLSSRPVPVVAEFSGLADEEYA